MNAHWAGEHSVGEERLATGEEGGLASSIHLAAGQFAAGA